jgi:hypothetical protein
VKIAGKAADGSSFSAIAPTITKAYAQITSGAIDKQ